MDSHSSWLHTTGRPHSILLQALNEEKENGTLPACGLSCYWSCVHLSSQHDHPRLGRIQYSRYYLPSNRLLGQQQGCDGVHAAHPNGIDAFHYRHTVGADTSFLTKVGYGIKSRINAL